MDIRERLGLVQSSLALLVRNLRPDDTIAIVTYGDGALPCSRPTPVTEWPTIVDAIDALEPGGSTNMEDGLRLGYEQARESFDPDAVNVVVLASDGVANQGVTDPKCSPTRSPRPATRASTSSPSATGWATTTTT